MTATIARLTYAIPVDESRPDEAADVVSRTGRLTDLLVDVYGQWKSGDAEMPSISFGIGQVLPREVVEGIFDAMRLVEARA